MTCILVPGDIGKVAHCRALVARAAKPVLSSAWPASRFRRDSVDAAKDLSEARRDLAAWLATHTFIANGGPY